MSKSEIRFSNAMLDFLIRQLLKKIKADIKLISKPSLSLDVVTGLEDAVFQFVCFVLRFNIPVNNFSVMLG